MTPGIANADDGSAGVFCAPQACHAPGSPKVELKTDNTVLWQIQVSGAVAVNVPDTRFGRPGRARRFGMVTETVRVSTPVEGVVIDLAQLEGRKDYVSSVALRHLRLLLALI